MNTAIRLEAGRRHVEPWALKQTPFHARTAPLILGHTWRRWAGHAVASAYDWTHEREYAAIRNAAALIDVSPLHKYMLRGRDAARLLDRMVTRNVLKTKVGQVLYTPWCDAHGKVIDDGTISRLDETTFRLTSAEPSLRWLHLNAFRLDVADRRDVGRDSARWPCRGHCRAPFSMQCCRAVGRSLKYFRLMDNRIAGVNIQISRTGYTGDLGYELWIPACRRCRSLGCADGDGRGLRHHARGHLGAGHRAHRSGARHARRRLSLRASTRVIEAQKSIAVRVVARLDRAARQARRSTASARSQREKARGPVWRFVGIEVDWDSLRGAVRGGASRCRAAERGLAREHADLPRRSSRSATRRAGAGRRCSRSTSRSRTCARRTSRRTPKWKSK